MRPDCPDRQGTPGCILIRLGLGAVFVYAGIEKIIHPLDFASSVYNYQLFPLFLIKPIALFLPFFEVIAGGFLLMGQYQRTMAWWTLILLGLFTLAMGINMARGLDINCGCFSPGSGQANLIPSILKNIAMMTAAGFFLFAFPSRKKSSGNPD